jgi:glycosyltransferase involved in cell wall biosynthesis
VIYLFVHQNFPAQYRHVIRHLADQPGNTVYYISQANKNGMPGIQKISYVLQQQTAPNCHPLTIDIDRSIRAGMAVADVCRALQSQGVRPDLIVGHSGWGETLFIKDVFPDVPLLAYFEFYYHNNGADLGFDPEFSSVFGNHSALRTRNAINLMAFESADWGHSPTQWQRSLHPPEMRRRITMIHEGIDTDIVRPNPKIKFKLPASGRQLSAKDEVVTYVSRNLEPYRGFHSFMRALPTILRRRPNAEVLIVGGNGVSYGAPAAPRSTYREMMLSELGSSIDLNRVHFLGQVDYQTYLSVLQVSSAHVYLTYPFVLSWSFIEALACGCLVIGSNTAPVLEVLEDRVNGLGVDFFSPEDIADRVEEVLTHKNRMQSLRQAARKLAVSKFDLTRKALPQWDQLLEDMIQGNRPRIDYS